MKLLKINIVVALLTLLGLQSCVQDVADLRERDYGYVQFKLYKAASYTPAESSRAVVEELDYLAEACKIEVNLYDKNGRQFRQSLVLSAANDAAAEYGLRSDKLKLLVGDYKLGEVVLFDALDGVKYRKVPASELSFSVTEGGLTVHDITIDVKPRGFVKFNLVKEFVQTRGEITRQYTFDEIQSVDISVRRVADNGNLIGAPIVLSSLPAKFSQHFDEEKEGWKTSSIECDSLVSLEAATYLSLIHI